MEANANTQNIRHAFVGNDTAMSFTISSPDVVVPRIRSEIKRVTNNTPFKEDGQRNDKGDNNDSGEVEDRILATVGRLPEAEDRMLRSQANKRNSNNQKNRKNGKNQKGNPSPVETPRNEIIDEDTVTITLEECIQDVLDEGADVRDAVMNHDNTVNAESNILGVRRLLTESNIVKDAFFGLETFLFDEADRRMSSCQDEITEDMQEKVRWKKSIF
jgi:hypothetical protein